MVIEGWLTRAAAARPEHTALLTTEGACSYAELYASARSGAHSLAARGAQPGTRVGIALEPGLAFARALHACLLLGAAAVPVDVRLSTPERERILSGCSLRVEEPLGAGERPGEGIRPGDGDAPAGHDLDAVAVVIHTSGSTGTPVPVELTYANLLWSALGSAVALGVDGEDRWLCALPVAHVGGLSILLRSAIYATTAVVHERFDTDSVLRALREERVSIVSLVATTLARLLDAGLRATPALRCVLLGGGPVPATLLARAREAGVPVALTYGLTEACSQVSTTPAATLGRDGLAARELTGGGRLNAGPPLFCTRVQIADDGEILVRGPTVARGSRAADGWLRTGDLGALDEQGRLSVLGRRAETIISGGENVAPAEVEGVLESHPLVLEAGVFAARDERWGEVVSAVVVPRNGERPDADELRAHCAGQLAPYKVPKRIVLASDPLPRTRSGKLLREELKMSFDPEAYRQASVENWEAAASGWRHRRELLDAFAAPVAQWMLDAVAPQPGERVLELAAGLGETGLLAAELVAPAGSVIISDQAEAMLDGARARAAELGIENVRFQVLNAEWIDLPLASVEIVLCRWGYMLMADPAAALSETRRVLAPGGRLALAVWDSIEHNPWAALPARELAERGLAPAGSSSDAPSPGPFTLGDAGRVRALIEDAGFTGVSVEALELPRRQASFEEFWETTLDLSRAFHDAVLERPQAEVDAIRDGLQQRFAPYTEADGRLRIPGRTLLASASA